MAGATLLDGAMPTPRATALPPALPRVLELAGLDGRKLDAVLADLGARALVDPAGAGAPPALYRVGLARAARSARWPWRRGRRRVRSGPAALRPRERAALLLADVAGMGPAQVGEVLGCAPGTADILIAAARHAAAAWVPPPGAPRRAAIPPAVVARRVRRLRLRRRAAVAGAVAAPMLVAAAWPALGPRAVLGPSSAVIAAATAAAGANLEPAWTPVERAPLAPRTGATLVALPVGAGDPSRRSDPDDAALLVWGGAGPDPGAPRAFGDGAVLTAGGWRRTAPAPLAARTGHTATVVGGRVLVWGGATRTGALATPAGGLYDARTDDWTALPGAPVASLGGHTAVSTDALVIVWGGTTRRGPAAAGAAYDVQRGAWQRIAGAPLRSRSGHVGVWTGRELVVWGGWDGQRALDDGAAYDPGRNRWRRIAGAPLLGRADAVGVWTGREVVIWGGSDRGAQRFRGGAAYDPARDRWRVLSLPPSLGELGAGPRAAVWTGREVVVASPGARGELLAYDADRDLWRVLPGPPGGRRVDPELAWTGSRLALWGGAGAEGELVTDGALHRPVATAPAPPPRRWLLQ